MPKVEPPKLRAYRIMSDENVAPHISNNILTLTICKPNIRKVAKVGDYILAMKAKTLIPDKAYRRPFQAAYLFRVDEVVSMQAYEEWCKIHNESRICTEDNFSGDCQYFGDELEYKPGPHGPGERSRNISGKMALISYKPHYAAWKSKNPKILTTEELKSLGFEGDEHADIGRGGDSLFMTPDNIAAADRFISEWNAGQNVVPNGKLPNENDFAEKMIKEFFQGGGTRKKRRAGRQSRRVRKQGK